MTARADLPRLEDLPIPEDVRADRSWAEALREMADYIGPYDTLRVVDALGGEQIYVPLDPDRSPFRDLLDPVKVATMARIYGGTRYVVPTGNKELRYARRAGVIAAVRAKSMSGADAAKICRTSRAHMAKLVNRSGEGFGAKIPATLPHRRLSDPRQIELFDSD